MSFIELVLARFTSNVQSDAPLEGKKTDKVEHELIQKLQFLSLMSRQPAEFCYTMIEYFRNDNENVKIFIEIMEEFEQYQIIYHSDACWNIIVSVARWYPEVILDHWERIHSVLVQSINSLTSLEQLKTSIAAYSEFPLHEGNTSACYALQGQLQSRIDAECLFDNYFEKIEDWKDYMQDKRFQKCMREFHYVFFLKFSEKHTFYSTTIGVETRLKDIVVRLREALRYTPYLRKNAFNNEEFKKVFRNMLEKRGCVSEEVKIVILSKSNILKLDKLLTRPWLDIHAELIEKPVLGHFNLEKLGNERLISSSEYADVKLVISKKHGGIFTAAKIINNDNVLEELSEELELLMRTRSHPHLIDIYGYIYKNNQQVGFLMERCGSRPVSNVIHSPKIAYKEGTILKWCTEAASGLIFLHSYGIIHKDVTPDNMRLTKWGVVKISNLGVSKFKRMSMDWKTGNNSTDALCFGTPGYRAPELDKGIPYTKSIDVYSLGQSIRHMVDRKVPGTCVKEALEILPVPVSRTLIDLMVKSNPQDRPSIEMVFDELQTQHKTVSLEQQMTEPDLD